MGPPSRLQRDVRFESNRTFSPDLAELKIASGECGLVAPTNEDTRSFSGVNSLAGICEGMGATASFLNK